MAPLDLLRENSELKAIITSLEIEAAQKNEALKWYATQWVYEEGDDARAAINAKAAVGTPSKWLENHDRELLWRWMEILRDGINKTVDDHQDTLEKRYAEPSQ